MDTADAALALARGRDAPWTGSPCAGVTGYEGHCSLTPERELRHKLEREAMAFLVEVAEALEARRIALPDPVGRRTATWDWTAAYPGVTEIQAGTYVVMDNFHGRMVGGFEHSLTVQSTVISRPPGAGHRRRGQQIDRRRRAGLDRRAPGGGVPVRRGARDLRRAPRRPTSGRRLRGPRPGLFTVHGQLRTTPTTWSRTSVVVDVWPVIPRGPGHHGLLAPED